ncbi:MULTISPECIES: phosphate ABC transporter permease PstA [Prochlorococcus]|uniref:Phosphate transport system permease protein PstA n=1 Tax=Prochlorococcus marinus (strain SARG / CCMP1375 / SS120) TaxID=167539 RepID=Q7VCZ2_PROMA|nr:MULTISPECIES: phosphate ABC transporter permease PstA [Prochlorococcus]AAP99642.1 ABC-type phosphate transport system permease component [Prochlorococcus marinus subsp. marinus str. CCMP1375]KGG11085.1 Phosphate transport system permease protein PstA [Prochlorococcus marinus str. LG]KGG21423.1 Phosphate transport system permease protein PstA [Prochlorococcus marinus str. SS2]KGG23232.1 Phosphate transport system permease protein PstA [Prochlorococcus marinus str. SS35]KGG33943.1 Phosphate t
MTISKLKANLIYDPKSKRNLTEKLFTSISAIFSIIAILPLVLVLAYILIKGGSQISWETLILEPEPPGDDLLSAGGIGPAIIGTFIISSIASIISIPIGVGGGIYLAEYAKGGPFSRFIRFGTNVLAGVPSIIAGVFIYAVIVATKVLFGSMFSGIAGGMALSILMLPTVIKTTDESLKLVSDDLRRGSLGIGASMFTTVIRITLPAAFRSIATGIVLGLARAAGETAPLIFTALFSRYYLTGFGDLFYEMGSLSVLIYNFALEPYEAQNELAWAASFILVVLLLSMNILSKLVSDIASGDSNK